MKAMTDGFWRTAVVATPAWREAAERARFRDRVSADGSSGFAEAPRIDVCDCGVKCLDGVTLHGALYRSSPAEVGTIHRSPDFGQLRNELVAMSNAGFVDVEKYRHCV